MIIHALAAACAAFYLINVVMWHRVLPLLNRKPFNCEACLPAWLGLAAGLAAGEGWWAIETMFIAGIIGIALDRGMKRYL